MSQKVFTIDEVIERLDDIRIDYDHPSKSYKGTTFHKIYLDQEPLLVKIEDETTAGQINPLNDLDVIEINRRSKFPVFKRKFTNVTIGFQKHPLNDFNRTSKYFKLVQKINSILTTELAISSLYQTHTSTNQKLENPITRVNLKFDAKTMEPKFVARDKKTERIIDGKKRYDPLLFNGELVTAENIHLLKAKSKITGVISFGYCKSKFCHSVVRDFKDILVDLYSYTPDNVNFEDVY